MINGRRYITTVFWFIFLALIASRPTFGQWDSIYMPIQDEASTSPYAGYDAPAERAQLVKKNTVLSHEQAVTFYSNMCFFKAQILRSGTVCQVNPLTHLVDSVVDRLLMTRQKLRKEIKVNVTRFADANAFCFPDGTIFIHIGMVATTANETELAFILAHEIAHYAEQHSVKDFKRLSSILVNEERSLEARQSFRSLRFSREAEFEADAWAIALLAEAGYDLTKIPAVFQNLKDGVGGEAADLSAVFSEGQLTIDTAWTSPSAVAKSKSRFRGYEVDPVASGRLDDLFSSHPDIDKREQAATHIIASTRGLGTLKPLKSFSKWREAARFEQIQCCLLEENYLNALDLSLSMMRSYPHMVWLKCAAAQALYWLAYYKEYMPEDLSLLGNDRLGGKNFFTIYALIQSMPLKDMKKTAYSYTLIHAKQNKGSDALLFYLAATSELYFGKTAARINYVDYVKQFPRGAYFYYANHKIQ